MSVCVLCGNLVFAQAQASFPSETNPFVENYYIGETDQDAPFFDEVLPEIAKNIKENNTHSISPYYDEFPLANNPENFQGLGSTTYANINGKTVTAEAFYRLRNESLHDPNNGMGLLIYQCIQYKRAHPEEDVKITFSSYRTSVTASVCVLPESKYYGYMRSLYGTNYDEHGFVRISYMLTEAARMGIEVTLVNQLPSYSVAQYNPKTGKLQSRSHLNFNTYYTKALETDCYDTYAPGKKVSDFMDYVKVGWNVTDKTGDMQHCKSATVSHYLATDGTEHGKSLFFSSANLDENNYIGANGNNSSQSGVIISDHDELYRVTYNYMKLISKYRGIEQLFELRKIMNLRNNEQIELIKSGRGDEIPSDEQIVYLGSESDPVFELYFTPFGGSPDSWNPTVNPVCKYADKLPNSEDYVELIWNEFGYSKCYLGNTLSKKLEQAFCGNPNVKNKISMRVSDFNTDAIQQLSLGSEIGYRSINDGSNIHSKDILMSYQENGVRHRVSLLTSCNFYLVAFNSRTNSMLVIHESDETDGNFYNIFGEKYSYNMINNDLMVDTHNVAIEVGDTHEVNAIYGGSKKLTWSTADQSIATVKSGNITAKKVGTTKVTVTDGTHKYSVNVICVECVECYNAAESEGITFSTDEQYVLNNKLGSIPCAFEATFSVEKESLNGTTTIIGNDGRFDPAFLFGLTKAGNPRLIIRDVAHNSEQADYIFRKVDVATGEKVHLAVIVDFKNKRMRCYVNGELKQTITGVVAASSYKEKHNAVVGGDHRNGNATYFPGTMESVAIWSDIRTAAEIKNDYEKGLTLSDSKLLAAYDFTRCENCMGIDLSAKRNNLNRVVLWQDKKDVEPVKDFEYSFAVIGDTQTMCEKDPEAMTSIYDWILENKKSEKIEYVIGLGDITNHSTDKEWDSANAAISRLNGKIPYLLSRGNHDDWDDFNRNLHNGFYETTVDGTMSTGEVSLTDGNQPGVLKVLSADGTIVYKTREGDVPEGGTVAGDLTNSYRYFTIQGTDYLFLTLDFAPSEEILDWANSVIKAHPKHKVIVVTHAYMYRDGTTLDDGDCYPPSYYGGYTDPQNGDDMWEKCFSKHKNVVMVLSGHDPWQHIVYRQDEGAEGNIVTQMLIDPQYVDSAIGSTAMVAMFYFSDDGNTLTVRYYSVEKECYGSVASQFTIDLNSHTHNYVEETKTLATLEKNGKFKYICPTCSKEKTTTVYRPESFTLSEDTYTYNGKVQTPTVTVKDVKGKTLKENVDYKVTYSDDCKNAGTYEANVEMIGKYSGSKTLTFKINRIAISKCDVKLSATSYTYDGKVKTPAVTITNHNGNKLIKDTHYTISYAEGRKNAGTYKVTVKMKGNYSGKKNLTFKINPISVSKCKLTLSSTSYTYNGKVKTPTVSVKNHKGTKLIKGTHYTISYAKGRKNVGTYKVTVKMKGNYSGTKTLTFKINPKKTSVSKLTAAKRSLKVSIKKQSKQVSGYQVQYSTSKKFTESTTKAKTVKSYKTTSLTLKSLKAKKTYYVRVRTYKTVNGKKYYSGWSSYKSKKTK